MSTQDQEHNVQEQDNQRRDFIRSSALAAGAVAAIGIGSHASAQEFEGALTGKAQKLSAAFDARYQSKITKEDVYLVLERMFDIAGCPTCGLNGFDFNLAVTPIFEVKSNIPVNVGLQY